MSDDVKHSDDELNLQTEEEDIKGDDVSTDAAEDTSKEDDPSASLDLQEDEGTEAKREAAKQQQVKGLAAKILTGELTYDSFPAAQKWLLQDVMDYVSSVQGKNAPDEKTIDERVNQLLEEKEFEKKLAKVKSTGLSVEENQKITERYKRLRSKGFSKMEALEDALAFHRIDLSKKRRKQPVMRESGGKVVAELTADDYTVDEINSMSPRELARLKGMK